MLRGSRQPGAGIVWNARLRPPLEGSNKSVMRELLGYTDVADDACETGNEPGRLDPPDGVDGAMGEGRRHGYPSHHLQSAHASLGRGGLKFAASLKPENPYAFGAKSSGPKTWRTSVSPSQPGQCFL
jgi:hypothetical protein